MKDPMASSTIDHNNSQLNILSANARKRILFSSELLNSFVNQHYYDFLITSEYHDDAATAAKNDHLCMTKRCVKGQGGVLVYFKKSLNITRAFECETDQNDIIVLFAQTKPKITCFIAVYSRPGCQNNYNRYLEEQQRFTTDIETAKQGYWSKISKSMKLRTIQKKMSRKPQQPIPYLIDKNNKKLVEKHEIVQEFIDKFCFDNSLIDNTDNNSGRDLNTNVKIDKFIASVEMNNILKQMSPKKAADFLGIQIIMIQQAGDLFHSILLKVFNARSNNSVLSTDMESYKDVSIRKEKTKFFIQKIISHKLIAECENLNILHDNQFEFRKGLGTEDAQLFLAHQIAKGIDKHQVISAAFLDVSKAFNSIDPNPLLTKLNDSSILLTLVSFIRSFCEPRQAYISIENDITSKVKLSSYGIPQGSSLSPVIFTLDQLLELRRITLYYLVMLMT
ncbi:unnamed protein product [Didymodactylos carnosus]|uniref:Reverse transcriptase domain-containing protein n=1 Tax=Didymodactylos carnosus TaxID=1234261 RepID=A0A8S2JZB2_9BILA|nr:unnamed protein product [Didymodactylos carnosus]CAF3827827.1 unnamed protein product [Didymodactylos carnosus]